MEGGGAQVDGIMKLMEGPVTGPINLGNLGQAVVEEAGGYARCCECC